MEGNMKMLLFPCVLLAAFAAAVSAQTDEAPRQVLTPDDMTRFISTFEPIMADFQEAGKALGRSEDGELFSKQMYNDEKIKQILSRYGWDISFFKKASLILHTATALEIEKKTTEVNPELKEALLEIDRNPSLTPEMKEQMKQRIRSAYGSLNVTARAIRGEVHPQDVELVKQYHPVLIDLFERM
jgi:hypothetical protein